MQASFNNLETYAKIKQKFNSAWPNLTVQAHYSGHTLWKEGWDEFGNDALLSGDKNPGEILFVLSDDTTIDEATKLFLEHLGGEVFILSSVASVQKNETLDY